MNSRIITQRVLIETTGELESKDYRETKRYSKVKGGYRMTYKSYDDIQVEALKSSLDIKIFLYIRDKYTWMRIENILSARDIAEENNVAISKVSKLISTLVDLDFLVRINRGIYRMNPFMFIPYKSNAEELQKEWKEIQNELLRKSNEQTKR